MSDEIERLRNALLRDPKVRIGKDVKRDRIRALNDAFRSSGGLVGGRVVVTAAVNARGPAFVMRAVAKTAAFRSFGPDNDPHGEHDFGVFELEGEKLFWKIDYYDKTLEYGSDDPADPAITERVLTILFAEDY